MRRSFFSAPYVALLVGLLAVRVRGASFEELSRWVPDDANVILVVDTAKALKTPIAQERYWKAALQLQAQNQRSVLAAKAERQVVAAHFNSIRDGIDWEVLLLTSDALPTMNALAAHEKSTIERIGGAPAFPLRGQLMAVQLTDSILGVRFPAERQVVNRWVKSGDSRTSANLPFIKRAVGSLNAPNSILAIGLDLDGALSPENVQAGVSNLRCLRGKAIDQGKAAACIGSVRTALLSVSADTALESRLELVFGEDPALFASVAGPLVREIVESAGLSLEEMKNWTPSIHGRSIVMTGPITGSGVLRICSLLTLTKPRSPQTADAADASASKDPAVASQEYFKGAMTIMDDVKKIRDMDDPAKSAIYLERFAKKIEALPMVNVDPDLLKWSAGVSLDLADCSFQLRDAGLDGRRRMLANVNPLAPTIDANVSTHTDGSYSDSSYYAARNEILYRRKYQARENRKVEQEAGLSGREIAAKLFRGIDESTIKIRREMTLKYKVEF